MKLWVDYIFLDVAERTLFAQNPHEYLIETVQPQTSALTAGTSNSVRLNFNHPVKELVWVATQSTTASGQDNFTNFLDASGTRTANVSADQLSETTVRLNGQDRFSVRDHRYFNTSNHINITLVSQILVLTAIHLLSAQKNINHLEHATSLVSIMLN